MKLNENESGDNQVTWLTTAEMADRLHLHPVTLHRLAKAGRVKCLRAGRVIRWPLELVEAALMEPENKE